MTAEVLAVEIYDLRIVRRRIITCAKKFATRFLFTALLQSISQFASLQIVAQHSFS
jgi:hypothetical protein